MEDLNTDQELPTAVKDARNQLEEHKDLRKSILELSMETLSKGQVLLEKLREASSRADLNSRHAAKSACYGIERTLEALQGRRRKLEEVWKHRKHLLEQCVRSCKLDDEIKRVTEWLRTEGDSYLDSHFSFGDNASETEELIEMHSRFEKSFKDKCDVVQKLQRDGQKLVHTGHYDAATIKYKVNKLDEMFKGFSFQLEQRRRILNQTHGFYRSSQPALDVLDKLLARLQASRDETERARTRSQAAEAAQPEIREGKLLLTRIDMTGVKAVLKEIEQRYFRVMKLTEDVSSDDEEIVHVNREVEKVSSWVTNIGEEFLTVHTNLGTSSTAAKEFCEDHGQLMDELKSTTSKVKDIKSSLSKMSDSRRRSANNPRTKLERMEARCISLQERLEYRLQLVRAYLNFVEHSGELLKKLRHLEEELTSDEPCENSEARPETVMRQRQERENIKSKIRAVEREGDSVLEELKRCPQEESLDRDLPAQHVINHLGNITDHAMHLDELWEQREVKLKSHKRFSSQFFDFEKEIRKVITWIHEQGEKLFPIGVEFEGLITTQKALQSTLQEFEEAASRASKEVEDHLTAAEGLALLNIDDQEAVQIVTNELRIAHERFKSKLAKHQAFLSLCLTFYSSAEKLTSRINKMLRDFAGENLPHDSISAKQMLQEHVSSYKTVEGLFTQTVNYGKDALKAAGEEESFGIPKEDIEKLLKMSKEKHEEWERLWEAHKQRLQESVNVCHFEQDISQVKMLMEEQTRHLLEVNKRFGNSLLSAVTLSQQSDAFVEEFKLTELRVQNLRNHVDQLTEEKHPDSQKLNQEVEILEQRWQKLQNLLHEHRKLLEIAVEFYQFCEQVETWLKDTSGFVRHTKLEGKKCRTKKEIDELVHVLEAFKLNNIPIQSERISKTSLLASQLQNTDARNRAANLINRQDNIIRRLDSLSEHLQLKAQRLNGKQENGVIEVASEEESSNSDDQFVLDEVKEEGEIASNQLVASSIDFPIEGGQVISWHDDLEYGSAKRPRLSVAVKSGSEIPHDAQSRITPVIQDEMERFMQSATATYITQSPEPITLKINNITGQAVAPLPVYSQNTVVSELRSSNQGDISVLGPYVKREVTVETDYNIETSQPEPLPLKTPGGGLIVTKKKTLKTTTKEVTTTVKQEIKTEMEFMHVDSADDLPRRIGLGDQNNDKVGISVSSMYNIEQNRYQQSSDRRAMVLCLEQDMKETNENICRNIEDVLFDERKSEYDPASSDGASIQAILPPETQENPRKSGDKVFRINAKDASNRDLVTRQIPKTKDRPGDSTLVEVSFKLEDADADVIHAHDDAIDSQILGIVDEIKAEERKYVELLDCISKDFIEQIAIAPLKLQKQRDIIFRNIKEILVLHKNHILPDIENIKEADDIARILLKMETKLKKYSRYISKAKEADAILESVLFFKDCIKHRLNISDHLASPQKHLLYYAVTLQELMQNKHAKGENCQLLQDAVNLIRNMMGIPKLELNDGGNDTQKLRGKEQVETYVVSKLYTPKRKDELALKKGDCVNLIEERNGRCYVETLSKDPERGWIPLFCLQRKSNGQFSAPLFTKSLSKVSATEGKPCQLSVQFSGAPEPDVQWYRNGQPLRKDSRHNITKTADSSTLIIRNSGISDGGLYSVKAINSAGSATCQGELFIETDESSLSSAYENGHVEKFNGRAKKQVVEEIIASSADELHAAAQLPEAPKIVKKLHETSTGEGGHAEFHVEVYGYPQPVLAWYLKNEVVEENESCLIYVNGSSHSLSMRNVSHKDAGVVKCVAINELGRDESEALLRIDDSVPCQKNTLPKMITLMKSLELVEGSDAHFVVTFEGNPAPDVNWFKDSIYLTDDYGVEIQTTSGRSELFVPDIGKDDAGKYHCVISNRLGRTQCSADLYVSDLPVNPMTISEQVYNESPVSSEAGPPVIIEKPGDIRVFEGDSVCLVFRAVGEPMPRGVFLWEDKDISDDIHFSIENADDIWKLIVKQAELYLQGIITFIAENPQGQSECNVRLRVEESIVAPMFTKTAENIYVKEGDRCQFTVKVKGKPLPRVEWYRNGKLLNEREGLHFFKDGEKHSLTIKKASNDYVGKFKCVAVNNAGEASCSAALIIEGEGRPPKFLKSLIESEACEGDMARFDVSVQGKPKPEIKWYKNNFLLRESKRFIMKSEGENSSLIIKCVDEDDCGIFKCAATNSYGSVVSEAFLNVVDQKVSPTFSKKLQDVTLGLNSRLNLETHLEQSTQHETQWYKNGQPLKSSSRYKLLKQPGRDSLVIESVRQTDAGEYLCVVRNELGECSSSAYVVIPDWQVSSKPTDTKEVAAPLHLNTAEAIPTIVIGAENNQASIDGNRFVMTPGKALKLTIKETGSKDNSQYKLVAASSAEDTRITSASEEEQDFPPEFISALDDIDILKGKQARFEVGIIGQPSPKVVWLKDGVQLRESAKVKFGLQNRVHSITVNNCDGNDIGCYECVAINSKGRISCQAMLSVDSDFGSADMYEHAQRKKSVEGVSPKFHKTISDVCIREGEELRLQAIVDGTPFPTVEWYRENILLKQNDRIKLEMDERSGVCCLVIKPSKKEDIGEYECMAKKSSR